MPLGQLSVVDWTIRPGEVQRLIVEFWTDKRATDPDDVTGDNFEFTVRTNPRDTGTPVLYLSSGDGIDQIDTNIIRVTLTEEQSALIGGCKGAQYGLARNNNTIYRGTLIPEWAPVQGTP